MRLSTCHKTLLDLLRWNFAMLLFLSSGCAGLHLYDQSSLDAATKTQLAFTDAKLSDALGDERKLLNTMGMQEQSIVRRQTLARRNAALIEVVGQVNASTSWDKLKSDIDDRISALTKLDALSRSNLLFQMNDLQTEQSTLDADALEYRIGREMGAPDLPASCANVAEMSDVRNKLSSKESLVMFDQWSNQCARVDEISKKINDLYESDKTSLIGKATEDIDEIQTAMGTMNAEYADRKKALENAKKDYDDATNSPAKLTAAATALSEALNKLDMNDAAPILSKLDDLGLKGLGLQGELTKINEQRQAVLAVISYLNPTNSQAALPTNSSTFLTALLPAIKTAVDQIGHPPALHLFLVEQDLQIKADQLQNQIDSAEAEYNLKLRKRQLMTKETLLLNHASLLCVKAKAGAPPSDKPLATWITSSKPDVSRPAVEALADYASAWTLGQVQEEVVDYQLIAARHMAALDSSDFALKSWNNLIGVPLQQLVAYYGSGIKPETIANLIGAAGISAAVAAK